MTIHISHNDLDGVGCGILVKAALGASVRSEYTDHEHLADFLENNIDAYSTVIITDIAPSEAQVLQLAGEKDLLIIDHHKSSENLAKYPFVVHSNDKCATLLTYEKLTSMGYDLKAYEDFALCVDDFDRWLLKRPDSLHMNTLQNLLGVERFEKRFLSEPYKGFKPEEELLITIEEERKQSYIQNAFKRITTYTDVDSNKFAVIFAESYGSELGNYIIQNSEVDYVLMINAQRQSFSLRSRKDVDVSDIAVRNGGGGHKNAAGFSMKTDFNVPEILRKLGLTK